MPTRGSSGLLIRCFRRSLRERNKKPYSPPSTSRCQQKSSRKSHQWLLMVCSGPSRMARKTKTDWVAPSTLLPRPPTLRSSRGSPWIRWWIIRGRCWILRRSRRVWLLPCKSMSTIRCRLAQNLCTHTKSTDLLTVRRRIAQWKTTWCRMIQSTKILYFIRQIRPRFLIRKSRGSHRKRKGSWYVRVAVHTDRRALSRI